MKIRVDRFAKKEAYTIGRLYIDGAYFCNTLEDRVRDIKPDGSGKVMHQTAIPAGTYRVTLEMSPSKKRLLPYLHDVPHFSGILIHSGNTADDSSGCILVGENTQVGKVLSSRAWETKLVEWILEATKHGETVTVEIG